MNQTIDDTWKVQLKKRSQLTFFNLLLFGIISSSAMAATIEVTPNTTQEFGEIMVGNSSESKTVTIKNIGSDILSLRTIDVYGNVFTMSDAEGNITTHTTGNNEFIITSNPCSFEGFTNQGTCPVKVAFKPQSAGEKQGTLAINSNDSVTPKYTIQLTGTGLPATDALIEVMPADHDFGSVTLNEWVTETFTIKNVGASQLKLGKISLEGAGFALSRSNPCSNRDLPPGKDCSIKVSFSPTADGAQTANLIVPSNSPSSPTQVVLSGNGFSPPPTISVNDSYDFGGVHLNNSEMQNIKITNTGKGLLKLGEIALSEGDFGISYDYCSNQSVKENRSCSVIVTFAPTTTSSHSATLSIPSNDPNLAVATVNLTGSGNGWCTGNYERYSYVYPERSYYGSLAIGDTVTMYQSFYTWAKGCDAFQVEEVAIVGDNASEFQLKDKYCYAGSNMAGNIGDNYSYAYCSFSVEFTPTSEGSKSADINVKLNTGSTSTIALSGNAVTAAQYGVSVTPSSHDFGETTVGSYNYDYEPIFRVKNTGTVNLNVSWSPTLSSNDFWAWYGCYGAYGYSNGQYSLMLQPTIECPVYGGFSPKSEGGKQATMTVGDSHVQAQATMTGIGTPPVDCSDENITIESVSSGVWAHANQESGDYDYSTYYNQPSTAWKRLKNTDSPNYPLANDVVRINAGHTITAIPWTSIRALCIEENATLESANNQQYYPYLSVYATDTIENKGTIKGKDGSDETNASQCSNGQYWWDSVGKAGCAQMGTQVSLSANGIFHNEGTVVAGHGGSGSRYGAPGGTISIWAMNVTNTDDIGFINAGRGGNITGTSSGEAGYGGAVWMWGSNSLTSDGRGIYAGNGGNCNPSATAAQTGGNGGNMRLNAANSVNLLDGTFSTGKGGKNCTPLGTNGRDGGFNTDPSVLNLSGANTKIDGGDITIYGGNDWVINLTNLSETALTATGDITLATGRGGAINLLGSTGTILKAGGQVTVYANQILLDEGKQLSDFIDATNIIVAPAKVLRDVTISAPPKLPAMAITQVPIEVTLANGSPEVDTYQLSITDTQGWNVAIVDMPQTVDIAALSNVQLIVSVAIPSASIGTINTITVNAVSQTDMNVAATAHIQIEVVEELPKLTTIDSNPWTNSTMFCPQIGTVDAMCDNKGNILTDVTLTSRGVINGGQLAGTLNSEGTVSQVTIQSGAILKGGKVTGTIINEGTIHSAEFRGGTVIGGTLAGIITNNNTLTQKYLDVHLAPSTRVRGGILQGTVIGDENEPAWLEDLVVDDDTELSGVVIGASVTLGKNVKLGRGVRFARSQDVPRGLSLSDLLPLVQTTCSTPVIQPSAVDLSADIVVDTDGILAAINAIPLLKDNDWQITQDAQSGYLQLEVDGQLRFAVQPWLVQQTAMNLALQLGEQYAVRFVTNDHVSITTQPAVQNLCYLAQELAQLNLQITVQDNGNLHIATADNKRWFSARPDWTASIAPPDADIITGLHADSLPVLLTFADNNNELWQQAFYPAPADMEALFAETENVSLSTDGNISFEWQGKHYEGILDYVVNQSEIFNNGSFQVQTDEQGWLLIYPQGEMQRLW